jgi:hypothetical protein
MVKRTQNAAWCILIIVEVLTVLLVLCVLYVQLNMSFVHTFLTPATAPGVLVSDRVMNPFWWAQILLTTFRILGIVATAMRIAAPRDQWYPVCHGFTSVIWLIVEIAAIVIYFIEIAGCNNSPTAVPSGVDNMCNDYRWCCVYGTINAAPDITTPIQAGCPLLLAPCAPAVTAPLLKWNFEFQMGFGFAIPLLVSAVAHLGFGLCMGKGRIDYNALNEDDGGDGDDDGDDTIMVTPEILSNASGSGIPGQYFKKKSNVD